MSDHEHTTIIGPDTHIKGEMVFETSACVLGRFEGRIASKGELTVGDSATCKASIDATRIVIDGTVEGDIIARERLELNAGATINGDIVANKLIVAEGASFIGHCRVGEAAVKAAKEQPSSIPIEAGRAAQAAQVARNKGSSSPQPLVGDIESTLAGFEAKLSEFSRSKTGTGA
jgi:cytoskeletal protein CcmA (bactofilin family)